MQETINDKSISALLVDGPFASSCPAPHGPDNGHAAGRVSGAANRIERFAGGARRALSFFKP
jgi:hypothetical protein